MKTLFMAVLALSVPFLAHARTAFKPVKQGPGSLPIINQGSGILGPGVPPIIKSLVPVCGQACATKIGVVSSKLGTQTKAALKALDGVSLGAGSKNVVSGTLAMIPGLQASFGTHSLVTADGNLGAVIHASRESGKWDAQSRGNLTRFVEGVRSDGVMTAVKNTWGITSKSEANKKLQEIRENCRI